MTVLADSSYPMLDVFWTMVIFFAWVIWIWTVIAVFVDLFSRHDVSGWGKAGWTLLVLALPFLGVLIYLIAYGSSMAERRVQQERAQAASLGYVPVQPVHDGQGRADEISKAKALLDDGAITTDEYEVLKEKALSH